MSRIEKNTFIPGLASKSDVRKVADVGPLYCPLIKFDLANGRFSDGFTLDKNSTGPAREVWKRFKKGFPSEIIIDVVDTDIKDWRERVSLFLDDHDIYSGSHTSNYYSAPFDYNGDVVGLLHIRVRHEEDDETVQFSRFDLRDEESRKATVFDLNLALRGKVDKVTGKGLSANDFTDALKAKLEGLRNYDDTALNKEIDKAKMQVFIDLWNQACYQYGGYKPDEAPDPAKPFLLNGLWFSYEEALEIYNSSNKEWVSNAEKLYKSIKLRTVLPVKIPAPGMTASEMFTSSSVTRISFVGPLYDKFINLNSNKMVFAQCNRLEAIEMQPGVRLVDLNGTEANQYIFQNCVKLREVRFYASKKNFDIHWSPLLSLASVQSFVPPNAAPSPCTITVHPDVYAKLTGDTTNEAAAALTEEEAAAWQQIVVDAAAKNISFATV